MPLNRRHFLAATAAAAAASGLATAAATPASGGSGDAANPSAAPVAWAPPADPRYRSKMRLGLFTWPFNDQSLDWVLAYAQSLRLQMLELGTGNDPGDAHCPLDALLADAGRRREYRARLADHGLGISAFSCHGNPLDPDVAAARRSNEVFLKTLRLAEMMDVPVVNCFSGCPGDDGGGARPNWVASLERPEYVNLLAWQWRERVIPYWRGAAAAARRHGRRVGLEFDPGYSVYNVSSLLRLRAGLGADGEFIGCNLDLSNMFAQGVEGPAAIQALGEAGALFHFHAKDAVLDPRNYEINGFLDLTPYDDVLRRSWSYAVVGYGHDTLYWRRIVATLKNVGYDYTLSIEHEDPTTAPVVGARKSAEFLKTLLLE